MNDRWDSTSTFSSFISVNVGPLCYHNMCHHGDDGIDSDGVERSKPLPYTRVSGGGYRKYQQSWVRIWAISIGTGCPCWYPALSSQNKCLSRSLSSLFACPMSRAVGHLIKAIKPAVLNDSMMASLMYLAFNAHSDVRPAWDLITSCQHGGWHRVTAYPPYPPSYLSYPPHASPIIQCQCNTQLDKDQFWLFLDFHHQGLSC